MPFDASILTDAGFVSRLRDSMATTLDTQGLRDLGAGILARSIFTAEGASTVYAAKLKEVIDALANGELSEGQAKTALIETLQALGYTPEGGFPSVKREDIPPALAGTIKDLSSNARLDLIVQTQQAMMAGAGQQFRGHQPERLAQFPAWELVRFGTVMVSRDWPSRWAIAGGKPPADKYPRNAYQSLGARTGMIALKGDPVWGELGSYENFPDALGVDHAPFYFRSEMGLREVDAKRCREDGITGPNGETIEEFHSGMERPRVIAGQLPLPAPRMSLDGIDKGLVKRFRALTHATTVPGKPASVDYSDILEREVAASAAAYEKGGTN